MSVYKIKRFSKEDDEYLQRLKDRQQASKKISYAALPLVGGWIGHGLANKNKVLGTAIGVAGGLAGAAVGNKLGDKELEMRSNMYKNSSDKMKKAFRTADKYERYTNPMVAVIDATSKNKEKKNVQS